MVIMESWRSFNHFCCVQSECFVYAGILMIIQSFYLYALTPLAGSYPTRLGYYYLKKDGGRILSVIVTELKYQRWHRLMFRTLQICASEPTTFPNCTLIRQAEKIRIFYVREVNHKSTRLFNRM